MPLSTSFQTLPAERTYVCAGHGIWRPAYGRFVTPANVTLLFWVHHGEALTDGVQIEELLLKVNEDEFRQHGYNRDVRTLATPENLARFEARGSNQLLGTAGRSRNLLPEVIGPREDCYNYELSYDNVIFAGVTNAKINLLSDYEGYAPASNVFVVRPPSTGGQPMMLRDIVRTVSGNTSEAVQVHWSACRAIDRS